LLLCSSIKNNDVHNWIHNPHKTGKWGLRAGLALSNFQAHGPWTSLIKNIFVGSAVRPTPCDWMRVPPETRRLLAMWNNKWIRVLRPARGRRPWWAYANTKDKVGRWVEPLTRLTKTCPRPAPLAEGSSQTFTKRSHKCECEHGPEPKGSTTMWPLRMRTRAKGRSRAVAKTTRMRAHRGFCPPPNWAMKWQSTYDQMKGDAMRRLR
jgi:hypothetical protein